MEYKELVIRIPDNYDLSNIQNGSIASKVILDAVANGTLIPDNATNGDVIQNMFPNLRVEDNGGSIYLHYPNGGWIYFDRDWWNAPHKKGIEE